MTAAMKNVLSPISLTRIINADLVKPSTKPSRAHSDVAMAPTLATSVTGKRDERGPISLRAPREGGDRELVQ